MWSKKLGISPSKLLIPLSYASGMGGVCTLIGTPPNLIISGLYADKTGTTMNVLTTTIPGLFCLLVGVLSIIAMRRLLPDRKAPESDSEDTADYTVELLVPSNNKYVGETVDYAGLFNIEGARLIKIRHFDDKPVALNKNEFVMGGDRLTFAGHIKDILQLAKDHGLEVGDEVINVGIKTLISALIMIAMVTVSALGILPLLHCAFIAAAAMIILRCCSADQAMRAINWDILMVFAGSVVLGLAIQKTGIAERLAMSILDVCGTNPLVVMTAICFVGTFITEFISNTAAGAMFFPIMYEAAEKLGYEPFPFLVALMISVSSSFATPIGSPTHMLVYGPGGYRFSDFMRVGLLMNVIILAANIFIVNIVYPLKPNVIVPQAPDYTDTAMWVTADRDSTDTGADIFYVVSTWEEDWKTNDGHVCHYADVYNPTHREHMGNLEINKVAAYMSPGNRFYAPYYRHTTIEAFMTQNADTIRNRTRLSMDDVCKAFDHFQAQRDKSRPMVIAGFSQGGLAVVELLKHMDDETYSQLAAAYVLGYKVTPDDTLQCKHIKAAKGESDTGVTICYNTVKDVKYKKPILAETCMAINPVNWCTDATPATLHDSITVTLAPNDGVLVVKGYSGAEYPAYKNFINVGDIHSCEPWLYSECLAKNIRVRAAAWRKNKTI
jgi:di/tricarboxylate transporter